MNESIFLAEQIYKAFSEGRFSSLSHFYIVEINPLVVFLDVADVVSRKHTRAQVSYETLQSVLAMFRMLALE